MYCNNKYHWWIWWCANIDSGFEFALIYQYQKEYERWIHTLLWCNPYAYDDIVATPMIQEVSSPKVRNLKTPRSLNIHDCVENDKILRNDLLYKNKYW